MAPPEVYVPTIAIVGSGPTAIYTIRRLVAHPTALKVMVFEAGQQAGVGVPYDPERNTGELLANIASVELPPVCETLLDYLHRCDDRQLGGWGLRREDLNERGFYPRVALGSYFAEQLTLLVGEASRNGHSIEIVTQARVRDIVPVDGVFRLVVERHRRILDCICDKVVLATGHADAPSIHAALASLGEDVNDIAILGSSLSAIDLAIAIAGDRGLFDEARRDPGAARPRITMMSRGGRLPEADFFCPLPAAEADGFREKDVLTLVGQTGKGHVLDAVFTRFAAVLAASDPDYAERIGLAQLTADTFAAAYFAERDKVDPFVWARRNLEEVRRNASLRHVVDWRYAILRCHEAFASCVPSLDADELRRFGRGLKRVFVDNYAAVPPRSIERLLELRAMGVLRLERLDDDYRLDWRGTGGGEVVSGDRRITFDRIFDARGQAVAADDTFPFPTLRALLMANHDIDRTEDGRAVRVDETFQLVDGANALQGIWCCSLPYLMDRRPFIQGLTSCAEIGKVAAEAILDRTPVRTPMAMSDLVRQVRTTSPILMQDGLVLLALSDAEDEHSPAHPRQVPASY